MLVITAYVFIVVLFALIRKTNCFNSFIDGSKQGITTSLSLMPTIIGLIVGINIFIKSGVIDLLKSVLSHPFIVPELVLQILFKPLSANSSLVLMNTIYQTYDPNSLTAQIATVIQNASDTTIYVIAVYYSFVKITKTKYVLWVGLLSNLITFVLAIILCWLFLS